MHDAPPRLLDQLVRWGEVRVRRAVLHCTSRSNRAWEPRWLLPGETIVADEAQGPVLRRRWRNSAWTEISETA